MSKSERALAPSRGMVPAVPDPIFAHPRLAGIYDANDADRSDLDAYLAIADELGARSLLDVGCGTGTLACLAAARGLSVVGVDPADASLQVARAKPEASAVRWLLGDATTLPPLQVDLATMTGNVAQVFLDDGEWQATLAGVHAALRPSGHLVFEVRDPARRAWEKWTPERSRSRVRDAAGGVVETWVEVTDVSLPTVSFRWSFRFESDGETLTSDSTLRFRERDEIEADLANAGFGMPEVRDAPDRPGLEWVFLAPIRA